MEGSVSGSAQINYGSGSVSRRLKIYTDPTDPDPEHCLDVNTLFAVLWFSGDLLPDTDPNPSLKVGKVSK
jgi:hypothetical protein